MVNKCEGNTDIHYLQFQWFSGSDTQSFGAKVCHAVDSSEYNGPTALWSEY